MLKIKLQVIGISYLTPEIKKKISAFLPLELKVPQLWNADNSNKLQEYCDVKLIFIEFTYATIRVLQKHLEGVFFLFGAQFE